MKQSYMLKKTKLKYHWKNIQLWLTAPRWMNYWLWVGWAWMGGLLPSEPVGVACCRGAVRNRKTRWAAFHRRAAPRHTHLWCTKPHKQGNRRARQTRQATTSSVSQNELWLHPQEVNTAFLHIYNHIYSSIWFRSLPPTYCTLFITIRKKIEKTRIRLPQYMEFSFYVKNILYTNIL